MTQGFDQNEALCQQSEGLLQGPLKHTRTAALALALVPLAAVAATSAAAPETCPSGGICGTVFFDQNGNGVQDAGEPGIEGVSVTVTYVVDGTEYTFTVATNPDGLYDFGTAVPPGEWPVSVQIPNSATPSPTDQGGDDTTDSDGTPDGQGNSVAKVTYDGSTPNSTVDFGFTQSAATNPGTGTPGYWMNHPEAWPVQSVVVGGVTYTKAQAIALLGQSGKDKTLTMFSSLVPAILNLAIGNDGSCVQDTIAKAQEWMVKYPVGSRVAASSYAWKVGEPLHRVMDNYNNGMLCAPHRN